ncbi:glycosyltransferase [Amycolatopsis sp. 195334CR]|uniref:glycosyltransferase n=1 Tax=Amycolatopsis sp. 195334CR TaxID=2814588 RepID=UPI001A8F6932|nr:glycosyltransferase [Amycolatopsis sp. 195334CR]MBN6036560.1 glycosyltransferase family 1 protein [Amycolatopsis sp. 195334CR]
MRIIFSSLDAFGHFYPLLPLATAAGEAGHEVAFATGEQFHPTLTELGIEPLTAGKSMREVIAEASGDPNHDPRHTREHASPEELERLIARAFGRVLPRVWVEHLAPILAEREPDLVVQEVGAAGAAFAALLAGVPVIGHGFGRVSTDDSTTRAIAREQHEFARELGLDLPEDFAHGLPFVDIAPRSLQDKTFLATANRIELRPVPFATPGPLPALARADRPRPLVYLTLGTAFGAAELLREAIDGLAPLDADVLVAAGPTVDLASLGELPPNVVVESWVPQADLLPFTDLVVHHGGSGTTLGALAAGVPQLVLPQGADQFTNAAAVLEAGAGDRLLAGQLGELTARARALLSDVDVRTAARAFAGEIAAMPSPAEVARRLPEYVKRG